MAKRVVHRYNCKECARYFESEYKKRVFCSKKCDIKYKTGKKNPFYGKKHTIETKNKISSHRKGKKLPKEWIEKIRVGHIGTKKSIEARKKMSEAQKGEKGSNWKGGITALQKTIRTSLKYRIWRDKVFRRDRFTCQECGIKGAELQAHHIKPLTIILKNSDIKTFKDAENNKEIWGIKNGQTLCVKCHKKTDSYLNIKLTKRKKGVVIVCGHFNPVHIGHINMIKEASKLGNWLIVVVCNDYQAKLKRPKVFLPATDRAIIMKAFKSVDEVIIAKDRTTHIAGTLKKLKPAVFANGCNAGHPDLLEEMKVCERLGIEVVLNVGGPKIRNSSEILKDYGTN